ncbi:MAG: hypothetical protein ACOCWI_02150 [Bacillota bacterium]
MKKYFLTAVIIAIVMSFLFVPVTNTAFAEEDTENQGYELGDGYLAEIVFNNFNMKYGNIERMFTVTFDNSFYDELPEEGTLGKDELMDFLSNYINAIGFEPEIDEKGKITGIKEYESSTDLYIELGRDGYDRTENDYEEESSFFFTESTSKQTTIFEDMNTPNGAMNMLKSALTLYGIEDEEILLSYNYGTPYKNISSDAEKNYYDSEAKIYVHEFHMSVDNSAREIVITQTLPNTQNWYMLAILISIPVVLATITAFLFHRLKEKRRRG